MKSRHRARSTLKIVDLQQELGLPERDLRRVFQAANVRVEEGQKNVDYGEAARVRQYLHEQRRREELKKKAVAIPSMVTVQQLSEALQVSVGEVLSTLLKNGVMATINDTLDYETAAIVASDLGYTTQENVAALEQETLTPEKLAEILKKEDSTQQKIRPPVITMMGHVDHGKTTLLDTIRSANVAAHEAGGITQAISSYQVEYKGRPVTFIDTPGHETFEFMRKRGASLADIAILVVAADDGVKPQTKEAVRYAREAKVPIIVAITKTDKPNINIDRVKSELAEIDLAPEDWGGKTIVVPVSAVKKQGIDDLLEMVLLTADILQPKAIYERPALGSVVESKLDKNVGPMAVVLIHTGTLRTGEHVVVGRVAGRIRRLLDFRGKVITAAEPGTPVTIVGLEAVPQAGDILQVVEAKEEARFKAGLRRAPVKSLNKSDENDRRPTLPLVIKADSQGSLEALIQTITSMVPAEIRLSILRAEVGYVSDSDVLTAQAAHALIYAFNTKVLGMAKKLATKEHVPVKMFNVIYHLSEDVRQEIEKRLPVDKVRTDQGRLKVLKVFFSIQKKKIIGGEVTMGVIEPGNKAVISRRQGGQAEIIGEGEITEIQKEKRAVQIAQPGDQIGLTYVGKGKIKEGDVLEIYKEERIKQKLST